MRRPLLFAAAILALVLIVSGTVFEFLFDTLPGETEERVEAALFLGSVVDVLLIAAAATVLIYPFYRRVRTLEAAVQRQQAGDAGARAGLEGSDFLADLGRAFDGFADSNAQYLDNQRALLRAVSHELRTPVARLRFALADLVSAEPERRAELREQAEADIEELDALVGEILAFVRVGPGGEPRAAERFDLVGLLHPLIRDQGSVCVEWEGPEELEINGEPHLVRRAVSNLIRNAVEHAQSSVTVRVSNDGPIVITVSDDGPGLPPDADARIFEPFVRLDDRPGGTGLGLSIAHAVAERHEGSLEFATPDKGAEFRLTLPCPTAKPPPRETSGETL
jgi:two-component system sensor histidine kinase RstB